MTYNHRAEEESAHKPRTLKSICKDFPLTLLDRLKSVLSLLSRLEKLLILSVVWRWGSASPTSCWLHIPPSQFATGTHLSAVNSLPTTPYCIQPISFKVKAFTSLYLLFFILLLFTACHFLCAVFSYLVWASVHHHTPAKFLCTHLKVYCLNYKSLVNVCLMWTYLYLLLFVFVSAGSWASYRVCHMSL